MKMALRILVRLAVFNAVKIFADPVPPTSIPVPDLREGEFTQNGGIIYPVNAQTWDGRIFFRRGTLGETAVFRPELLKASTDSSGRPQFSGQLFSNWVQTDIDIEGGSAVQPNPAYPINPYKSEKDGKPNLSGSFETYQLHIFRRADDGKGTCAGRMAYRLTVSNPRTESAAIDSFETVEALSALKTLEGSYIFGIEAGATFDGRLVFVQSNKINFQEPQGLKDGGLGQLFYSYNSKPGALTGWSKPKMLPQMYYEDRDMDVAGVRFQDRYPLARAPIKKPDGSLFQNGEAYPGAYPWINWDGDDLIHTTMFDKTTGGLRAGFAIVGARTGHVVRLIDGPINPDRDQTPRQFVSSAGLTQSIWSPYRDVTQLPIPIIRAGPVYSIFTTPGHSYHEVSMEDYMDRNYLLFLRMNELITYNSRDRGWKVDATRTPDTSGNQNNGMLSDAFFSSTNIGISGQAIVFSDKGKVTVNSVGTALGDFFPAITVGFWVKPLTAGSAQLSRNLISRAGVFNIVLSPDEQVNISLPKFGSINCGSAQRNEWTHFAFSAGSDKLRCYRNGIQQNDRPFSQKLPQSTSPVIIGPAASGGNKTNQALILDEVTISNVERDPQEIKAAAFIKEVASNYANSGFNLPKGLKRSELKIPVDNPFDPRRTALGRELFFESRLSKTGKISCASCHQPQFSFADSSQKETSVGITNTPLQRNTPTIINRAFSSVQFFDGRALSLEEQVIHPLTKENEMGLTESSILAVLNAQYSKQFSDVFQSPPSIANLKLALASFQRTLFSGDSKADRFEAGEKTALNEIEQLGRSLFYGKARCFGCHAGSNFTDESFHNLGFFMPDGDLGREGFSHRRKDQRAFKTPTLRDIALTAPYFHNGSVATLEAVVEMYNSAVNFAEGDRDLGIRPLNLQAEEKAALVAYLRALKGNKVNIEPILNLLLQ